MLQDQEMSADLFAYRRYLAQDAVISGLERFFGLFVHSYFARDVSLLDAYYADENYQWNKVMRLIKDLQADHLLSLMYNSILRIFLTTVCQHRKHTPVILSRI